MIYKETFYETKEFSYSKNQKTWQYSGFFLFYEPKIFKT